jgi:glycosyltransferase involved in cell wall biosynthesis
MSKRKRIGIVGGNHHSWVSVDRTRQYYIRALEKSYEIVFLDKDLRVDDIDLLINFSGETGWTQTAADYPRLMCIHGGAILDQTFLKKYLPNLTTKDGLIVNCQSDMSVIRSLCSVHQPKMCLLPLPVKEDVFYGVDQSVARDVIGMEPNVIQIGMVSRLLPQKNPHVFLRIFKEIKEALDTPVKGIVVGNYWVDYPVLDYVSENYPEVIQELLVTYGLEEDVVFLSADLSDSELNCIYNSLDLLIHPTNSLDENFGYVPIEAMACGTPVVGALYGGLKDSIQPKVGIGIPTWCTNNGIRMDAMTRISDIIDFIDKEKQDLHRKNCLDYIEENYSFNTFHKRLSGYIDELIGTYDKPRHNVELIPAIEPEQIEDSLPETSNGIGWSNYRSVVNHYVSCAEISFNESDLIYADCDYEKKNGKWLRKDPAWPALYELTRSQETIVNKCLEKPVTYEEFLDEMWKMEDIQYLLANGVLVVHKRCNKA